MERIAVIGYSGGGKSTLSRDLAARRGLPWIEIDRFLWQPGWIATPPEDYEAEHARIIAQDRWLLDRIGRLESVPARLARATEFVLIDLPIALHLSLAEGRQAAWAAGTLENPPAGAAEPPSDEAIRRNILEIERDWMPDIRAWVDARQRAGGVVHILRSLEAVSAFARDEPAQARPAAPPVPERG